MITNYIIGKYYPNLFTQFIIGCVLYIIFFFIVRDLTCDDTFYKDYQVFITAFVSVDVFCFIRNKKHDKVTVKPVVKEATTEEFTITHDLSTTESDYSIFSTSDEKDEKIETSSNIINKP